MDYIPIIKVNSLYSTLYIIFSIKPLACEIFLLIRACVRACNSKCVLYRNQEHNFHEFIHSETETTSPFYL